MKYLKREEFDRPDERYFFAVFHRGVVSIADGVAE